MWRTPSDDRVARAARRTTIAVTAIFALVLCRWRPWTVLDTAGFSNDFYDEQARAFLHLRLWVPPEVAGPEGFLIGGRTYLYYGPLLALARVPFVITGEWFDGRLTRLSMIVAFVLLCTVAFALLRRVAARLEATVTPWRAAVWIAAVTCSPVLALAGWVSVYHETELWALTLFLLTVVLVDAAMDVPAPRAWTLAGLAAAATLLTRASVGYGATAILLAAGVVLWRRDQRRAAYTAAAWSLGALGAGIAVNLAKFGTLVDLPADRQVLTLLNADRAAWFAGNGGSFFSTRFLPTTMVQYLRPDAVRVERLVPFVRFGPRAHEYGSYPLEGNTPAASLPSAATLLTVAAVIGVFVLVRRRGWFAAPWMIGAAVAAAPTLLIGFVANRYLVDLLPLLVVPAVAAFAGWQVPRRRHARAVVRAGAIGLVVWGAWCNVALAVWISELKNPGFTALRYDIDGALFGGRPPSVVRLSPGLAVPRDGVVAIDGECEGLYIAEQGRWVPLELADGVRRLRAVFPVDGAERLLVEAADGALLARRDSAAGTVTLVWNPDGGDEVVGTPVTVDDEQSALDVRSDPVTGTLVVSVDGQQALTAFAAPSLADAALGQGVEPEPTLHDDTPICDDLQAEQ